MNGRRRTAGMRPGTVGVETPERTAAVRASRQLVGGAAASFDRVTRLASRLLHAEVRFRTILDGTRTRAGLRVPVTGPDGHVLGELCATATGAREWSDEEVCIMRDLAAVLEDTIALRHVAQDLEAYAAQADDLAVTLQESLLPARLPRIAGIDLATRYAPGGTGSEVLGDFYDVIPRADGGFAMVIGDVAGKGAAAARVTGLVRSAAHGDTDPVAVLGTVNEVLVEWFSGLTSFVTAVYAVLTPGEGGTWCAQVCSAGHPSGFLRRADGTVTALHGGGRVLGVDPHPPVGHDTRTLRSGDLLLFYTDGITEARDHGGLQFEEEGVVAALTATPAADAERTAAAVVDAAREHAGHTNDDDIAVVAVRIR